MKRHCEEDWTIDNTALDEQAEMLDALNKRIASLDEQQADLDGCSRNDQTILNNKIGSINGRVVLVYEQIKNNQELKADMKKEHKELMTELFFEYNTEAKMPLDKSMKEAEEILKELIELKKELEVPHNDVETFFPY